MKARKMTAKKKKTAKQKEPKPSKLFPVLTGIAILLILCSGVFENELPEGA